MGRILHGHQMDLEKGEDFISVHFIASHLTWLSGSRRWHSSDATWWNLRTPPRNLLSLVTRFLF